MCVGTTHKVALAQLVMMLCLVFSRWRNSGLLRMAPLTPQAAVGAASILHQCLGRSPQPTPVRCPTSAWRSPSRRGTSAQLLLFRTNSYQQHAEDLTSKSAQDGTRAAHTNLNFTSSSYQLVARDHLHLGARLPATVMTSLV